MGEVQLGSFLYFLTGTSSSHIFCATEATDSAISYRVTVIRYSDFTILSLLLPTNRCANRECPSVFTMVAKIEWIPVQHAS